MRRGVEMRSEHVCYVRSETVLGTQPVAKPEGRVSALWLTLRQCNALYMRVWEVCSCFFMATTAAWGLKTVSVSPCSHLLWHFFRVKNYP